MSEETGLQQRTEKWVNDIHQGDAVEVLETMPESSVHCAMTSPPYFGLRDYGVDGQIGLEESIDEYIDSLLEVAEALRRVLRDDGSWWLNLGDSFAGSWGAQSKDETENNLPQHDHPDKNPARNSRIRRKSKMLVPHRVAIALEDAGWIVRSDAVWAKPNPMPHPVKDRLNEHKEYVFHLTPEPDYWFDLDAIREPHKESSLDRNDYAFNSAGVGSTKAPREDRHEDVVMDAEDACHPNGKNPGDIIEIPVKAFPEAHFAVYPPELCETPIKSSCPEKVCAECGAPYERVTVTEHTQPRHLIDSDRQQARRAVEKYEESDLTGQHLQALRAVGLCDAGQAQEVQDGYGNNDKAVERLAEKAKEVLGGYAREFLGEQVEETEWKQACECETDETGAGIVLDPFAGAGTTALVAKQLGRRFVGIDLNPEYVAMAQKRVGLTVDEPEHLLGENETNLQAFTDGGEPTDE